jgi:protein subunit release factor B
LTLEDLDMHWREITDVQPAKVEALKARIARLGIDLAQIEERFVRGGGRGGQKINKTANCVTLVYRPMAVRVRCQRDRRRSINRFLALRELADQVEMRVSPETSERLKAIERIRRAKDRARRRAAENRPQAAGGGAAGPVDTAPRSGGSREDVAPSMDRANQGTE